MARPHAQILVIDDDASVRSTTGALLQRQGYAVTLVASADLAVRHMQRQRFDVLVLELIMPGMSYEEFVNRAGQLQPQAQIIILTGSIWLDLALDDAGHARVSRSGGVFDYLLQTCDPLALVEQVEAVLRRPRRPLPHSAVNLDTIWRPRRAIDAMYQTRPAEAGHPLLARSSRHASVERSADGQPERCDRTRMRTARGSPRLRR